MVVDFLTNFHFIVPVVTLISGQIVKQFVFLFRGEPISWRSLLTDGGLPSSHSATMSSLTATIFFVEGLSTIFYLSFFVTLVVAKDAFGVRRESGKHARLITKMMKKLDLTDPEHIKLLVGHTKTQVIAGLIWGVTVAVLMNAFIPAL